MEFIGETIDEVPSLYGLDVGDVDGDGRPDVVAGSTAERLIAWYRAPSWERTVVSRAHSGNIGLALHDIDADGRADLAVASGFNPGIRAGDAYLHWLRQPEDPEADWEGFPVAPVPFLHRIAWADVDGDGRRELVAAAIRGPEGGPGDWSDPGWLGFYRVPADPRADPWPLTVVDAHLHVNHGLSLADLDGDGGVDLLVGAREGLLWYEHLGGGRWARHRISTRETSETYVLSDAAGRTLGIAAVEPWHGNVLCWYPAPDDLRRPDWERRVLDESLEGGHSLACGDLDGDGLPEIVTGSFRPGTDLRVYRAADPALSSWSGQVIDPGLGPGQTYLADLDGDGRPEVVSSGIPTGNLRSYRLR